MTSYLSFILIIIRAYLHIYIFMQFFTDSDLLISSYHGFMPAHSNQVDIELISTVFEENCLQ